MYLLSLMCMHTYMKDKNIINLLEPNVNLSWRTVRVFKSASKPNVDLTWREYVSNLEGICSPLHVT